MDVALKQLVDVMDNNRYKPTNYVAQALKELFDSEMTSLHIGNHYNKNRIHLMLDLINILDYWTHSEEYTISSNDLTKYTRYYERLLK